MGSEFHSPRRLRPTPTHEHKQKLCDGCDFLLTEHEPMAMKSNPIYIYIYTYMYVVPNQLMMPTAAFKMLTHSACGSKSDYSLKWTYIIVPAIIVDAWAVGPMGPN